ncbi:MAG: helix-hairpin-helix domain-containing protein [Lactobacillus sp.]|nr:helix-hairpin-helix domain-containing protein [Lactobacillus sp.]MDN6052432.1 helix-hairpin-helix domain-containing protein [Lactobacillus sp.]
MNKQDIITAVIAFVKRHRLLCLGAVTMIGVLIIFFSSQQHEVTLVAEPTKQVKPQQDSATRRSTATQSEKITVDLTGAVKHQGVYTLARNSRLQDLLEFAGGLTQRAQLRAINRAVVLQDQAKVYIPYRGEKVTPAPNSALATSAPSSSPTSSAATPNNSAETASNKVNLNTASVTDLQKLTGIGPKKAEQIIAYRTQNGGFKAIEDLTKVSGIGEKTFAALKDQLAI